MAPRTFEDPDLGLLTAGWTRTWHGGMSILGFGVPLLVEGSWKRPLPDPVEALRLLPSMLLANGSVVGTAVEELRTNAYGERADPFAWLTELVPVLVRAGMRSGRPVAEICATASFDDEHLVGIVFVEGEFAGLVPGTPGFGAKPSMP